MASKRRKAAAAAAAAIPIPGAEETLSLKSPERRSSRRKAGVDAQDAGSPGGQSKVEGEVSAEPPISPGIPRETCSYKTPKRTPRSRSRVPTFSSPANETDVQQEIFWDPYSPIARKQDKGRKKQTTNGCTVEISEIVNRIAPQDERPAGHEGSLLGLWIGDDAIPCTPGIPKVRHRIKVNGIRGLQLKTGEEELMKLAKQFDKNLTDAIQDQDVSCPRSTHVALQTKKSVEHQQDGQVENQQQFLGEHPEPVTSLPVGMVKENSAAAKPSESISQKSIDLDVEVALNALFDCSPQKCSGHLSQGLSDCSPSNNSCGSQNALLEELHPLEKITDANGCVAGEMHRSHSSAPVLECVEPIPAKKLEAASEQTVQNAASCKKESVGSDKLDRLVGDDFDDWGADLLADDSFLMQITQNPDLIRTLENVLPCTSNENSATKERTIDSGKPNEAQYFVKAGNNNSASHTLPKQSSSIGKTKTVFLPPDCHSGTSETHSVSRSSLNKMSGCSFFPVKPEYRSGQEAFTQLKCFTSISLSDKNTAAVSVHSNPQKAQSGKCRNDMHNVKHQSSTTPANTKPCDLQKATSQGHRKQAEMPKKHISSYDDWNEPRFSDDVLELFCESDSLWGTNCDDDDNLLYRVCDDIERKTLSQEVGNKNEKAGSVTGSHGNLEVEPYLTVPKPGLLNFPQVQKSHTLRKTFSLDFPLATTTLLKNEKATNSSAQRSCAPFTNGGINSIPGKCHRSNSVPERGFASGSGLATIPNACLNMNDSVQQQSGPWNAGKVQNSSIKQVAAEKPKYAFRKTNNSQTLVLEHKSVNTGSFSGTHLGLGESKNPPNVPLHTTVQTNPKSAFKRHLSDVFTQAETDQRSRKCSQEEIARKKQEALERRKYKMQALLKNTAPT
ncbi:ewing's tumor-associated antigen 1 [Hemicordylus capensis]|uniref:ewing's tumor-associated antigen 1 n=1 Tax=Hemicordylus capensis TaxID=884348 RepID=UPI0023047140|nr:ewing's tumor-associated antigen 1 [Hemicordylus capensis]